MCARHVSSRDRFIGGKMDNTYQSQPTTKDWLKSEGDDNVVALKNCFLFFFVVAFVAIDM